MPARRCGDRRGERGEGEKGRVGNGAVPQKEGGRPLKGAMLHRQLAPPDLGCEAGEWGT